MNPTFELKARNDPIDTIVSYINSMIYLEVSSQVLIMTASSKFIT